MQVQYSGARAHAALARARPVTGHVFGAFKQDVADSAAPAVAGPPRSRRQTGPKPAGTSAGAARADPGADTLRRTLATSFPGLMRVGAPSPGKRRSSRGGASSTRSCGSGRSSAGRSR